MATKIQKRRDTAANWTAVNPVLAQGEEGLELDTGREKVGNGTANWNSLPYKTLGITPTAIGAATAAQGAKADTAIQPGNAALSDAREWSADTISQAEAEAGTATTRRAFTAARVFQAVAAWWAGSAAKTKLDGIASGATANSTDAQLRDRATHTGTQPASSISGLSTVATSGAYSDLSGRPDLSLKADLVNGLVPSSQLPGFVDDVVEFANLAAFPVTGEAGKLYIALNTNKQYRWAGSTYQEINPSPGSTDAIPEGSVNLYHTTLRAAAAAPVQSVAGKTGTITLAKGDVGLGNVDNTSDADKPVSTATAAALGGKVGTGAIGSSGLTMATARLLGRTTAGAGAVEEIQVSGGTFANGVLTLSGLPSTLTADASGNLTFTARWIQSTNGAASAPPMALTGTWFTGGTSTTTKPQLLIEPAGTTSTSWSTAGTGLGINAPSGFTGRVIDCQVNGTILFNVDNATGSSQTRIFTSVTSFGGIANATSGSWSLNSGGVSLNQNSSLSFSSTNAANSSVDLYIFRDAANTLAQRNGTAAQASRIYNTFTDSSNYERLAHTWVSNVCYTRPENAGTGSARLYVPVTGGTTVANLPAAATAGTGARSFVTDANATTFLSTVAGGGSNRVPVVSDGTNWLIA